MDRSPSRCDDCEGDYICVIGGHHPKWIQMYLNRLSSNNVLFIFSLGQPLKILFNLGYQWVNEGTNILTSSRLLDTGDVIMLLITVAETGLN